MSALPSEPDPVFAALAAATRARQEHLSALDGLNEDDEAQMRRANAAADADTAAFEALAQVIPTTLAGLRALAERYAIEAEADERWASASGYLQHIARALRVCESPGGFSGIGAEILLSQQAVGCLIPNAVAATAEGGTHERS